MGAQTFNPIVLAQGLWDRYVTGDSEKSPEASAPPSASIKKEQKEEGTASTLAQAGQALAEQLKPIVEHPVVQGAAKLFKKITEQMEPKIRIENSAAKLRQLEGQIAQLEDEIDSLENPHVFREFIDEFRDGFGEPTHVADRQSRLVEAKQTRENLRQDYLAARQEIKDVALLGMEDVNEFERSLKLAETFEQIGDPDAASEHYAQILFHNDDVTELEYASAAHSYAALVFQPSLGAESTRLSPKPQVQEGIEVLRQAEHKIDKAELALRRELGDLLLHDPQALHAARAFVADYYNGPKDELRFLRSQLHEEVGEYDDSIRILENIRLDETRDEDHRLLQGQSMLRLAHLNFAKAALAKAEEEESDEGIFKNRGYGLLGEVEYNYSQQSDLASMAGVMRGMQKARDDLKHDANVILMQVQENYPESQGDLFLRTSDLFAELRSDSGKLIFKPRRLLAGPQPGFLKRTWDVASGAALLLPASRGASWTASGLAYGARVLGGRQLVKSAAFRLGLAAAKTLGTYTLYQSELSLVTGRKFRWSASGAASFAVEGAAGALVARLGLGNRLANLGFFAERGRLYTRVEKVFGDFTPAVMEKSRIFARDLIDDPLRDTAVYVAMGGDGSDYFDYLRERSTNRMIAGGISLAGRSLADVVSNRNANAGDLALNPQNPGFRITQLYPNHAASTDFSRATLALPGSRGNRWDAMGENARNQLALGGATYVGQPLALAAARPTTALALPTGLPKLPEQAALGVNLYSLDAYLNPDDFAANDAPLIFDRATLAANNRPAVDGENVLVFPVLHQQERALAMVAGEENLSWGSAPGGMVPGLTVAAQGDGAAHVPGLTTALPRLSYAPAARTVMPEGPVTRVQPPVGFETSDEDAELDILNQFEEGWDRRPPNLPRNTEGLIYPEFGRDAVYVTFDAKQLLRVQTAGLNLVGYLAQVGHQDKNHKNSWNLDVLFVDEKSIYIKPSRDNQASIQVMKAGRLVSLPEITDWTAISEGAEIHVNGAIYKWTLFSGKLSEDSKGLASEAVVGFEKRMGEVTGFVAFMKEKRALIQEIADRPERWGQYSQDASSFLDSFAKFEVKFNKFQGKARETLAYSRKKESHEAISQIKARQEQWALEIQKDFDDLSTSSIKGLFTGYGLAFSQAEASFMPLEKVLTSLELQSRGRTSYREKVVGPEAFGSDQANGMFLSIKPGELLSYDMQSEDPSILVKLAESIAKDPRLEITQMSQAGSGPLVLEIRVSGVRGVKVTTLRITKRSLHESMRELPHRLQLMIRKKQAELDQETDPQKKAKLTQQIISLRLTLETIDPSERRP